MLTVLCHVGSQNGFGSVLDESSSGNSSDGGIFLVLLLSALACQKILCDFGTDCVEMSEPNVS